MIAVESMAERFGALPFRSTSLFESAATEFGGEEVLLLAPQTYMNNSGDAVKDVLLSEGMSPADVLVIYDDFQIPFGALRFRTEGSDGGHNGIASVIYQTETEKIARLRIGIAGEGFPSKHTHEAMADYVLERFTEEEIALMPLILRNVQDACVTWLMEGPERTMSRYNKNFFSPVTSG